MAERKRAARPAAFRALAAVVLPAFKAMCEIRVLRPERLPASGAFVLAPNHYSEIDPLIVAIAVWNNGRVPRFLAKASLFKIPGLGAILRKTEQVPVERGGSGAAPIAAAKALVRDAEPIIIYPEGTLTRDPGLWPMRGKSGAVRTALDAGVPLIPAAHWGTQALMPRYGKGLRPFPRKKIDVIFGEPIDLSKYGTKRDAETLQRATNELMDAITALLVELRGEAAPSERWDPAKHHQSEHGRFDDSASSGDGRPDA